MKLKQVYDLEMEDWDELMRLSKEAHETPVMLVGGVDLSATAHERVQRKWEQVARKLKVRVDSIEPDAIGKIKAEPL